MAEEKQLKIRLAPAAPPPAAVPKLATGNRAKADIETISHLVRDLCIAFSNVRIFTWNNDVTNASFERAWDELEEMLESEGGVMISFADGKMVFAGMPVEERNPLVAKFSKVLGTVGISCLEFIPGMQRGELEAFFSILAREPAAIAAAGGIEELFANNGVRNIHLNSVVYKMVAQDERVVKANTVAIGLAQAPPETQIEASDNELAKRLLAEILSRRDDNQEFIRQLRRDPGVLAEQIMELMNRAESMPDPDRTNLLRALTRNIEVLSELAGRESRAGVEDDPDTGAKPMLVLEQELQRRTGSLQTKAGTAFLKRMTDIISMYSAHAKAGLLVDAFLEGEGSLQKVGELLDNLAPNAASGKALADCLQQIMERRGLQVEGLVKLLSQHLEKTPEPEAPEPQDTSAAPDADAKPSPPRPKKKRRIKQPLTKRLEPRIRAISKGLDAERQHELLLYVDSMISREVATAVETATSELLVEIERRDEIIDNIAKALSDSHIGLVVLNPESRVLLLRDSGIPAPGITPRELLPEKLAKALPLIREGEILAFGDIHIFQINRHPEGWVVSFLYHAAADDQETAESETETPG